jgi:PAS domain S-box-containing protein
MENVLKLRSFQKRMNEELKKNNDSLSKIPDRKIECWGWEINYENEIVYISPLIRTLLGYEPAEMLFHTFYEFISSEEINSIKDFARESRKLKAPYFSFLSKIRKKDNTSIEIEINGLGIYDGNGTLCGYEGIVIASKDEISKIKLS